MYGIEGNFVNTCNGYCEGSISVTASDGNSPYQYIWDEGKSGSTISNLCSGQYCVTVTDKSGCENRKCFIVGSNEVTVVRDLCTFSYYCNGILIDQKDIGRYSVVNSDCRYEDYYCSDGFYLGSNYVGTYLEKGSGCTIYEKCKLSNQVFSVHQGQFIQDFWSGFSERDCWWCHDVSYCYYPSLRGITDLNLVSHFEYSYVPTKNCSTEKQPNACYLKVYCNGYLIAEGCDEDCMERPCSYGDLSIRYEVVTESRMINGKEEIFHRYEIMDFDTVKVMNHLLQELEQGVELLEIDGEKEWSYSAENLDKNAIQVFPNPVSDKLSIVFRNQEVKEDITILITDIYGKDILQSKHVPSDPNNESLIELNCQDFVPGTYIISIYASNGELLQNKKLIKI